jgi:glycosyltransferase involved in cell wall biosynthesis
MTVSVIIPAYKVEKFLPKCIDSVIAQRYTDWELIVVVSPSNDRTEEIAREYAAKDSRIHVFTVPKSNCATARNIGISHATGKYIAMLDGDDWFKDRKLDTMVPVLEDNSLLTWVSSYLEVHYEPTDPRCTTPDHIIRFIDRPGFCPGLMGVHTILFRKSLLDEIKEKNGYIFNESMNRGDDGELTLRIRKYPSYHIHEYLTYCYANPEGLTLTSNDWELFMIANKMIIKNGAWDLMPPRIAETFVRQGKKLFKKVGL